MEHLLNLVWLVAVASVVLMIRRQGHRVVPGRMLRLGAVLCIAMVLFPVISASDDLHPGFDLSDDAAWRHEKRGPSVVLLIGFALAFLVALPRLRSSFFRIVLEPPACGDAGFLRLDLSRAPPAIS